jgi:O-antigen ligase
VGLARWRRLAALLLCTFLSYFSLARAGIVSIALVTLAFCFALRQYKLLMKVAGLSFFLFALLGMVNPAALNELTVSVQDAVLYKGHKDEGVLSSRRPPWEETVTNIKQHPWFGTGFGTGPNGEDVGLGFAQYSSTLATSHEHGSSYMTIVEGVGLLGVLPFVALMALNAFHVLKVGLWMHRTGLASHYSVPLAMVLFAGFIHATFEDWMFAVGYYLCVYFWALGFVLADLLPATGEVRLFRLVPGTSQPAAIRGGAIAPGR